MNIWINGFIVGSMDKLTLEGQNICRIFEIPKVNETHHIGGYDFCFLPSSCSDFQSCLLSSLLSSSFTLHCSSHTLCCEFPLSAVAFFLLIQLLLNIIT